MFAGCDMRELDTFSGIQLFTIFKSETGSAVRHAVPSLKDNEVVAHSVIDNPVPENPTFESCTVRNPPPPCKDGLEERIRSVNGTNVKCCYKSKSKKLMAAIKGRYHMRQGTPYAFSVSTPMDGAGVSGTREARTSGSLSS